MSLRLLVSAIIFSLSVLLVGCGDDPLVKEYKKLKDECSAFIKSPNTSIYEVSISPSCTKLQLVMAQAFEEGKISEKTASKDNAELERLIENKMKGN